MLTSSSSSSSSAEVATAGLHLNGVDGEDEGFGTATWLKDLPESIACSISSFLPLVRISDPEALETALIEIETFGLLPSLRIRICMYHNKSSPEYVGEYIRLLNTKGKDVVSEVLLEVEETFDEELVVQVLENENLDQAWVVLWLENAQECLRLCDYLDKVRCQNLAVVLAADPFQAHFSIDWPIVYGEFWQRISTCNKVNRIEFKGIYVDFSDEHMNSASLAVGGMPRVKSLAIEDAGDIKQALPSLVQAAKLSTSLRTLDLSRNQVGDMGAAVVADLLKANPVLRQLTIENGHISGEGAKLIALALHTNSRLTSLSLADDLIGDIGGCALAEMLKKNSTLLKLSCKRTGLGNRVGLTFADALKVNQSLRALCIQCGPVCPNAGSIGPEVVKMIHEAALQNSSLRILGLDSGMQTRYNPIPSHVSSLFN